MTEFRAETVAGAWYGFFFALAILEESEIFCPMLVGKDGRRSIFVDKRSLTVGKQEDQVDAEIPEEGISRIHAKLERTEEGGCRLTDLNSTNGTYVDGKRLRPMESVLLQDGQEVSFAGARYTVSLLLPEH